MAEEILYSTQDHLDILDIVDDLVLLKGGGAAMVLQTTSVNFDLLSEREQDAMIAAYGALLNSLTFPIQITIRSKRLDISAYTKRVSDLAQSQPNPQLRDRINSYLSFITSLTQRGEVLDKRFYIIIPHFEAPAVPATTLLDKILGKKPKPAALSKYAHLERAKTELAPKKDQIAKLTAKIGVKVNQLTTKEVVELFYDIYSPTEAGLEHLAGGGKDYTSLFVQPALTPAPAEGEARPPEAGRPAEAPPPQATPAEEKPAPPEAKEEMPKTESKAVIPKGPLSELRKEEEDA